MFDLPDNYGALGDPTCGYVSNDSKSVTDWHGQHMGRIVRSTRIHLARWSHMHGSFLHHYVVNINGCLYYGRSSPGTLINLRPYKHQEVAA